MWLVSRRRRSKKAPPEPSLVIRSLPHRPTCQRTYSTIETAPTLVVKAARRVRPWRRLLQLDDPNAVLPRIDEPRHQPKRHLGHAVHGLQAGQVVVLDLHASRSERGELRREVFHAPGGLGLRIRGSDCALADA